MNTIHGPASATRSSTATSRGTNLPTAMRVASNAWFDRISWQVIADPDIAADALRAGQVDWWEWARADLVPALAKDPNIRLTPTIGLYALMRFNTLQPPFNNVKAAPRDIVRSRRRRVHAAGHGVRPGRLSTLLRHVSGRHAACARTRRTAHARPATSRPGAGGRAGLRLCRRACGDHPAPSTNRRCVSSRAKWRPDCFGSWA